MCFSAQADLIGGVVITLIGVDAIRHVEHPREKAIAALPLVLGAHQLVEAFVWWGLQGHVPEVVGHAATWVYLFMAFVALPLYVPLAVIAIEPTRRFRLMIPFAVIGAGVAIVLATAIAIGPVTARLEDYHIAYGTGIPYGVAIVGLYVIAVCGSLLASSYRPVVVFGAVNLVVVAVVAWLQGNGFASIWCAWAAIMSAAIAVLMRVKRSEIRLHIRFRPDTEPGRRDQVEQQRDGGRLACAMTAAPAKDS